ncbi:MAG: WXG100 family type VII secretion target [Lachnospiraceae bacterium]|nr:WXG100 family type VII secretion target [Lachnospiraceae bacterium]
MAKSMYEINMDFNNAKNQAANLEAVAKNIENMINNDFEPCMRGISANWKGDNAENYVKKGNRLKADIEKTAKNLRKAASTIRTIAKNIYDAEKAAYEIAQARKYNG